MSDSYNGNGIYERCEKCQHLVKYRCTIFNRFMAPWGSCHKWEEKEVPQKRQQFEFDLNDR